MQIKKNYFLKNVYFCRDRVTATEIAESLHSSQAHLQTQ